MTATTDPAEPPAAPRWPDPGATHLTTAPGARLTSPVLVGRSEELAQLRRVARRPPALVLVEGEAGVGKTRLIREWCAAPELAGTARLVGHCTPLREPLPFGPVIDALAGAAGWLPGAAALSPVTGALRPLLPELANRLPPPLEPLGNRRQERHRVYRGIRDLLASLGPTVLVLEDLHWIDRGTQELLRFLVDRLPDQLTLVLTYRREDLTDPHAPALTTASSAELSRTRLVLRPLDAARVADLVAEIRGGAVPAGFTDHLHERTMGIPLAIEETLGLLWDRQHASRGRTRGRPPEPPHPAALPVPSALRDALLERVSRLRASARRLLHAAAVLHTPATEELLIRVAGLPAPHATAALVELVGRGLLRPAEANRYGFRHGLAQQAVYQAIAEPTRRQLHRRAIRALAQEESPPVGQLARHCQAAGETQDWLRYAEAAADQATTLGDDETATQLLREVVTRPDATRETRVRLAVKLGHAALTGLSHTEALGILRHTLDDPDLPTEVRGELRLCLGVLLRNQASSAREGRAELEQAIEELRDRPAPAARAMASLGAPYLLDGAHVDQHLAWLSAADRTAQEVGDPGLAALVHTNRAGALACIGDPDGWQLAAAAVNGDPGAGLTDQLKRCRLAVNLAWSATCVGRYRDAEALLRTGAGLTAGPATSYLTWCLTGTALLHDLAVGRWEGLNDRAAEVVATMSDVPSVVAEARLVLGLLAVATGKLRDAETHLAGAEGSVPAAAAAAGGLARVAAASGDTHTATRHLRHGLDLVRAKGVWCWAAELIPTAIGVLARTPQQLPTARKLLDEFAAGVSGRESPLAEVAVSAGRALLAEADGQLLAAAAQHGEAARAYRALPQPYAAAQSWEARGRCLLAAGRDGDSSLSEAMNLFEQLGAGWDVARCRHLLRSMGRRLPHRRGRRGYGEQLSPRERDVVRLVRTGLTNREIAETLFLSPRTVEAHVARVLRKLGLGSRRALMDDSGGAVGEALLRTTVAN